MHPLVHIEVIAVRKTFPARLAFVRFFAGVKTIVAHQVVTPHKTMSALITFEGLFASMSTPVVSDFTLYVKGQGTVGTLVKFFDAASLYMAGKLGASGKDFCAVFTLMTKVEHG